ncbi:SDR family oxidoreductase [Halorhodospira neutriphila]|uniref:Short-chain dehydrogenase/reductase SDR n=1 Tax=Halorhodospira neutriphila TaxID=168379 RepID=A0ABS1E530_9GAMM|nr:SDR family oxidoreductase [Halorhodospira neutriphila]MBK1725456.1 hypothetical protein [Halorhodospira neutriphila]
MTLPTILITGGTGKFGKQYIRHFLEKEWQVVFTSTSAARAQELEKNNQCGRSCVGIQCDFTKTDSIKQLTDELRTRDIKINHLVNNARSLSFLKVEEDGTTKREDFINEYLLDVVVPYELSVALWKEQPEELETIVNVSSQYGVVAGNPNVHGDRHHQSPIQYGTAKAAINHLTREMAVRMAPDGIRVNAVAYGGVEGRTNEKFKERYGQMVPNGRMLNDSEIPGPVEFLTSEASSAVTGHIIAADGGWTIW